MVQEMATEWFQQVIDTETAGLHMILCAVMLIVADTSMVIKFSDDDYDDDDDDDLSILLFSQNSWLVLTTLSMETHSWLLL